MWNTMIPNNPLQLLQSKERNCKLVNSPSKLGLSQLIRPSLNLVSESIRCFKTENYSTDCEALGAGLLPLDYNFQPNSDNKSEAMLGQRFGNRIPFQIPSLAAEELLKPPIVGGLCDNSKMEKNRSLLQAFLKAGSELLYSILFRTEKLDNQNLTDCPMELFHKEKTINISNSINNNNDSLYSEGYESDDKCDKDLLKSTQRFGVPEAVNTNISPKNVVPTDIQIMNEKVIVCPGVGHPTPAPLSAEAAGPRKKRKPKKKCLNREQDGSKSKKQGCSDSPLEALRVGGARRGRRKRRSSNRMSKPFCDYNQNIPKPSSSGCQRLYVSIDAEEFSDESFDDVRDGDCDETDAAHSFSDDFEVIFDCLENVSCSLYSGASSASNGIAFILNGNDDIFEDDAESVSSAGEELLTGNDEWQLAFKETFESFQGCLYASSLSQSLFKSKEEEEEDDFNKLISTIEEKSLREYEADLVIKEINKRWLEDMKDVGEELEDLRVTKVRFAPDEKLAEVREFEKCVEEDSEDDWFLYKLMRCRFAKRVNEMEPIISPCLDRRHRDNIFKKNYS